jgi:hypothetical protein
MSAIGRNNFYENKHQKLCKDFYEELSRSEKSIFNLKTRVSLLKTLSQQRTIQRKEKRSCQRVKFQ